MKLDTFRRLDNHDRRLRQLERVEVADSTFDETFGSVILSTNTTLTGSFQDLHSGHVFNWPSSWGQFDVYVSGAVYFDVSVAPAGLEWRVRLGALTSDTRGGTAVKTSGDVTVFHWFYTLTETTANPLEIAIQARKTSGTGTVTTRSPTVGFWANRVF